MPRYDYRCEPCEIVFEVERPAQDRSPVACPECDGRAKRVFSPVGVVFKGSGFHNTDYRKKDSTPKTPEPACKDSCATCPAKSETPKAAASDD